MAKDEFDAIYKQVRLNRNRLDSCERHKFVDTNITLGGKVRCEVCKGLMPNLEANQYVRGYIAAGGDANDVWPGFLGPDNVLKLRCPHCDGKQDFCHICNCTGVVSPEVARNYLSTLKG